MTRRIIAWAASRWPEIIATAAAVLWAWSP